MVISFSNDTVFEFLKTNGYVATFREGRRVQRDQDDWCNRGRGETKEFDVHVTELGPVSFEEMGEAENELGVIDIYNAKTLEDFAGISGFDTADAWMMAIRDICGGFPVEGYVYLVTKLGDDE